MTCKEGWKMYIDIKHLKEKGFSNSKISDMTGISRPTVIKYVNMTPEEFQMELESQKTRVKKPDKNKSDILGWLKQYPQVSSAQIYDWLEEKYSKIEYNEVTLRTYVRNLRKKYNISKEMHIREYEACEETPMGKQMQVDFGQKKVLNPEGNEINIYVMCFVLSHSRYKYCEWQQRPFTTKDIIAIHENAFEYFGGYPEEAVYDQDHLILTSENYGELIHTKEFAGYLQKRKFKVWMCKKSDPESKGKVEKVVDFVKDNFASYRKFLNIDKWNDDCLKWLERRANGKIHGTTRKIPSEVFADEKKLLTPILDKIISKSVGISLTYQVRKDNTVPVKGNRYTVPTGTYKGPETYVKTTRVSDKVLIILDLETDEEIATHEIPEGKGHLVVNNNHRRNKSAKISRYIENTVSKFNDTQKAKEFIEVIHKEKPRYTRDHLMIIEKAIENKDSECVEKALDYCIKYKLYSGLDFKDAVNHYYKKVSDKNVNNSYSVSDITHLNLSGANVKASIRDISEYAKIMNGDSGG